MKILRIIYSLLFLALSGVVVYYSIYFIWLYAIGTGWSGKSMSTFQFLWQIKAPILIALFSILSCIGLFLNKKWGSLLGLSLCICALFYYCESMLRGIGTGVIDSLAGLTGYVSGILILFIVLVGILKLLNTHGKLRFAHYATIGMVASSVLISTYTLFPL